MAREDFEAFIKTIAENNRKRDGSSPRHVANNVIVAPEYTDGGYVLVFNGRPYYDGQRATPMDIIDGCSSEEYYPIRSSEDSPSIRSLAVDITAQAVAKYYDEHGWEQNDGRTITR
jgi:hypothetical protein